MASTGCTPARAWGEWDIPSILAQYKYWRRQPPVHVLVALYLNYKAPAEPTPATMDDELAELQANLPQMPDHMRLTPQWPATRKLPNMR